MTKNTLKSFSTEELQAELNQRNADERKQEAILTLKENEEKRIYNLPENVEKKKQTNYNSVLVKTLGSYPGVSEKTVGTWTIKGEDHNCDMGGYYHSPHIGTVVGTLNKAILWAIEQPDFYSCGGEVNPARPKEKVIKL